MNAGRIEQVGTPAELRDRPATPFVREFLGHDEVAIEPPRLHLFRKSA